MYQSIKEQLLQFKFDRKTIMALTLMSFMTFTFGGVISVSGTMILFALLSQQIRNQKANNIQEQGVDIISKYVSSWLVMLTSIAWIFVLRVSACYFMPARNSAEGLMVSLSMLFIVGSAYIALLVPLRTALSIDVRKLYSMMFFMLTVSFMLFVKPLLPTQLSEIPVLTFTFPVTITALSYIAAKKLQPQAKTNDCISTAEPTTVL
ncbi:MAG: hypothetical protein RR205_00765 [Oscillospiraceae bacterium]